MEPFTLVAVVGVLLLGYVLLGERGAPSIARPLGGGAEPAPVLASPDHGTPVDFSIGNPLAPPSNAPPAGGLPNPNGTPAPASAPSSPASSSTGDLFDWAFGNGQDALKAGFGNVYKTAQGLSITGPYGALTLKSPDKVYATEGDALKAGAGSLFQRGGSYFVTGPAGAVKVSDRYQPHSASQDLSTYGSVAGVIRGWALTVDRAGNMSAVPAHSVAGSTYQGDAVGAAPGVDEWQALASARGAL